MALTFLQATSSTSDLATYTFSSQDLGDAASDRQIIVAAQGRGASATRISSITVGGVETIIVDRVNSASGSNAAAIAMALVPTGTTGDVVVTFGVGVLRCAIQVWRATSAALYAAKTSTADDPTASLYIPANGFVVAAAISGNASTTGAWSGVDENYNTVVEAALFMAGSRSYESPQAAHTVTCDFTTSITAPVGVFASFGTLSGGSGILIPGGMQGGFNFGAQA